ncbi:MAG: ABC transporter substrate-binding protein [Oscillospiraceae bacterium]|nr:ABC transporter substrate-binding protein [Oscillospiraceae bacterium]
MKKLIAILLCLMLVFSLAACAEQAPKPEPAPEPDTGTVTEPENNAEPEPEPEPEPAPEPAGHVSVGFLKGPTGMGAAYFMEQVENGDYGDTYKVTLDTDPSAVASALVSGELGIASLPTNAALTLYNKTSGKVRIAAINTLGVLYILEKGDTVNSVADLSGKTLYATGQGSNPEYVLNYILSANGLVPGEDVTIEYLPSDELSTKMAAGDIDLCMLPVPAATGVLMKNSEVREALDLTEEWNAAATDGSILTQGCVAIGPDVTDEQAAAFLEALGESINFMTDEANIDEAAALAEKHGIVGAAAVAKAAMPKCGMTLITGADAMRDYLTGYFSVLYSANPDSIGGSMPDDGFYWGE